LSPEFRQAVRQGLQELPGSRLTKVLHALGVAPSRWYVLPVPEGQRRKRGPKAKEVPPSVHEWVKAMAKANPWYGYKRIAVMCRRSDQGARFPVVPTVFLCTTDRKRSFTTSAYPIPLQFGATPHETRSEARETRVSGLSVR